MPKGGKREGSGRKRGVPNKTTTAAKEMIQGAASDLGGQNRLVAWAKEDKLNERIFWGTIYPKMLPLDITSGEKPLAQPTINILPPSDAISK